MLLFICSMALALLVSFLCSILEACLLSLSTTDIAGLSVKNPQSAAIWKGFKENIHKPIAVILIVNTIAHTIGAAVSGAQFNALFGSKWIAAYSLIFSLAMIQWTEILPKALGVRHNRALAAPIARPLKFAVRLFSPLVFLTEWINRPFEGKRAKTKADPLTDIAVLVKFASINNLITPEQVDLVSRSIRLSGAKVGDLMVQREEIKHLSTAMSLAEALVEAHIHHHTRYLLVENHDLDRTVGFVNMKDIVSALKINPQDPSLKGISRPVLDVRASDSVPNLLKLLTRGYQHMAVVKNEAGRTVGLITLEDIVEAIVGDLEDEYDVLPGYVYRIAEGRFLAGGGVAVADLKEKTGMDVPELQMPLNDWLCNLAQGSPPVETKLAFRDLYFIVRKVRRSKIHEVIVEKKQVVE